MADRFRIDPVIAKLEDAHTMKSQNRKALYHTVEITRILSEPYQLR